MSNYNNIRGKNQRNSNQDWNNDYDQDRNRNANDNDRFENDDRRNQDFGGNYGFGNTGERGQNDRGFDSRRDQQRNDFQRNDRWNSDENANSAYGSDRGAGQNRNDSWESGRNAGNFNSGNDFGGNRNFSRSGSGNSGFGGNDYNDRNRNQNQNQDRGWWDKTRDEVSSWFGDDQADRRRRQDESQSQQQGQHRGKGPKGYTRSDERIKEDINDRLSDDHHIDASDITVNVTSGEVVLSGTVIDRQSKRHAEDLAESISGVKNVENKLRVGSSDHSGSSSDTNSGLKAGASASNTANVESRKS